MVFVINRDDLSDQQVAFWKEEEMENYQSLSGHKLFTKLRKVFKSNYRMILCQPILKN